MTSAQVEKEAVRLTARNVGGIDETEVTFSPGVTILAGRNATNRTSLLQAIMAAMGSNQVSLKGDADEGYAKLMIDGETYTRTLKRRNGTVVMEGNPYLDDPEVADLFAFLSASNEARQAVKQGLDLRDLIMRPIDTEAIETEIDRLKKRRREIEQELEKLDSLEQSLPELENKRNRLEDQLQNTHRELEDLEEQIEADDSDIDSTNEEKRKLNEKLKTLSDVRTKYEEAGRNIQSQQDSIEALETELEKYEAELDGLPETPIAEVERLDAQIESLRDQKRSLDSTVTELQTIIQFNEDMLAGGDSEVISEMQVESESEGDSGAVTDQLFENQQSVVCWTCGSRVEQQQIDGTLDRIRHLRQEKLTKQKEVQSEIDELKEEKKGCEEKQREREELESRIAQIRSELERRRERIEERKNETEQFERQIEELEAEVEDLQHETNDQLLKLHQEANQLEFELGRLEDDLAEVESEIAHVNEELERREDLQTKRKEMAEELEDLRTRIESIEEEAVERFNEQMETVLDILEYDNLERIWIERRQTRVRQGRQKVEKSTFDLHVVRSIESGATYEDTVDHLSESEREITGIVFGFAGYLTHDLHDKMPFMLLDSLETVDSERIAKFLDYVNSYADHTVVALLPEDAQAVSDEYQRIEKI